MLIIQKIIVSLSSIKNWSGRQSITLNKNPFGLQTSTCSREGFLIYYAKEKLFDL